MATLQRMIPQLPAGPSPKSCTALEGSLGSLGRRVPVSFPALGPGRSRTPLCCDLSCAWRVCRCRRHIAHRSATAQLTDWAKLRKEGHRVKIAVSARAAFGLLLAG